MSDVNPTPPADPVEAVKDPTNPLEGAKPKEEVIPPAVEQPVKPDDESGEKPKEEPVEEKMVTVKALHEAKNENKELKKMLAEHEAEKKAEAEKTLAEQGKYEDLANQYKAENTELKSEIEKIKANSDKFEQTLTNEIAVYMDKIPDQANKTLVGQLLEGKTLQEKRELIPQLVEKFGVPTSVNPPVGGQEGVKTPEAESKAKYEAIKNSGNVIDMLSAAPIVK